MRLPLLALAFAVATLLMPAQSLVAAVPIDAMVTFDESFYYDAYPDVANAYQRQNGGGLRHYLEAGIKEKRSPNCFFDPNWYEQIHPDMMGYSGEQLLQHWQDFGARKEGRMGCPNFHLAWYRDSAPDLKQIYANDLAGAFEHYMVAGSVEGRPSAPGRHLNAFPSSLQKVQVAVNVYKIADASIWHTGIVIDDVEYYFDTNNMVKTTTPRGMAIPHHRRIIRDVPGDMARVKRVLQSVINRYNGTRYDLATRNCNIFVNDVLVSIGSKGLDREYLTHGELQAVIANTPGGATLQEVLVKWPMKNKRLDKSFREDFRRVGALPRDIEVEVGGGLRDARDRVIRTFKRWGL